VNFGPEIPEFKRLKGDQQFTYVRLAAPLLDAAGMNSEFCRAMSTQFCFIYWLGRHCYAARATRQALPRISSFTYFTIFLEVTRSAYPVLGILFFNVFQRFKPFIIFKNYFSNVLTSMV